MLLVNNVLNAEAQLRKSGLGHVSLADIQHGVVQGAAHEELEREIVDALAVGERLALLRPVPLQDQSVAEGQRRRGVRGRLVAIEHTAGEGCLDMLDYLGLERLLFLEALGAVFGPRLALGLRDGSCGMQETALADCSVDRNSSSVGTVNWTLRQGHLVERRTRTDRIDILVVFELDNDLRYVGFSPSTLLMSPAPKPVKVLLCLGLEMPAGPTDPCMSMMGAPMEGRRSLWGIL